MENFLRVFIEQTVCIRDVKIAMLNRDSNFAVDEWGSIGSVGTWG